MKKKGMIYRGETKVLDETVRTSALGMFADLADGMVHYEIAGPADAQTVVLVHGFSAPAIIWNNNFDVLAAAGFRVLRYDLYGRGYSDRPDVCYDQDLFDQQLVNLLGELKITSPVDLVGLSMGGAISIGFTDRHPKRVRRLCLIDPAGLPLPKLKLAGWLASKTSLGDWLMDLSGKRLVVSAAARLMRQNRYAGLVDDFLTQTQFIGFKNALLSTVRSGVVNGVEEGYRRVGEQGMPAMLLWGRKDRTIPFKINQRVQELIPGIEFHAIDGAGHTPHYEYPQIVNPLLIEFFARE